MTAPPSSTTSSDVLTRARAAGPAPEKHAGHGLGWALFIALIMAVSIAISLAVQLRPEPATRQPPECGGLYTECCAEWDDDWGPCIDDNCRYESNRSDERGLFDAEEHFADHRLPTNC